MFNLRNFTLLSNKWAHFKCDATGLEKLAWGQKRAEKARNCFHRFRKDSAGRTSSN